MAPQTSSLEVHDALKEDVYRDRARIASSYRGTINEGVVCKLTVKGKHVLLEVRGMVNDNLAEKPTIRLDEKSRTHLGVLPKECCQFTIRESWWIGQFLWAWNASDPTPRIAARLGILGLVLGMLGAVLGIISLQGTVCVVAGK